MFISILLVTSMKAPAITRLLRQSWFPSRGLSVCHIRLPC